MNLALKVPSMNKMFNTGIFSGKNSTSTSNTRKSAGKGRAGEIKATANTESAKADKVSDTIGTSTKKAVSVNTANSELTRPNGQARKVQKGAVAVPKSLACRTFCVLTRIGLAIDTVMTVHGLKDIAKLGQSTLSIVGKIADTDRFTPLVKNFKHTKMFMKVVRTLLGFKPVIDGSAFKKNLINQASGWAFRIAGTMEALTWLSSIGVISLGAAAGRIATLGGGMLFLAVSLGFADLFMHNKLD